MSHQPDLFTDEAPAESKQNELNSTTTLKVSEQDAELTPSQQRFNHQLNRIEKLKVQLTKIQSISDAHRPLFYKTITPLREQHQSLTKEMALFLDSRLQRKGLSRAQKSTATMILCHLCELLAAKGDEEMQALHDKHSTESLAQKEQAAISEARAMMEDMLGEPLADDEPLDNLSDIYNIGMERLREAAEAEQEMRRQKKAHKKKKPTAAQRKAETAQQEADISLRKVFRQLASALHPDRENDPDERIRKTNLMSEANAAYGRRDLVTLLQIQLRTELTDAASIAKMAEEKIASLTLLLKEQTKELNDELHSRRQALRDEFHIESYETISIAGLQRNLLLAEASLHQDLDAMQQDLQQIKDDKTLKLWLKEQAHRTQEAMVDDLEDWMIDPFQYK